MKVQRAGWLKCVVVLASLASLVSGAAEKQDKAAADFYAYSTRLDYTQPPSPPEMLGQIPVNAARTFAGGKPDQADEMPRPPKPGPVRWGQYADLVVHAALGGADPTGCTIMHGFTDQPAASLAALDDDPLF